MPRRKVILPLNHDLIDEAINLQMNKPDEHFAR